MMEFTCEKCGWLVYANGAYICGYSGRPTTKNDSCMAWKTSIITNADRIKAMTDEELSEIMVSVCPPNYPHGECREYEKYDGNLDCCKCWLDWLKEEAEGRE